MAPSILAGGLLVFIGAGSCFGIPAIVGMPGNIEVLTTRIVSFVYMGDDAGIRNATTLAVSLMVLANGLLFFMTWMMGRKDYTTIGGKSTRPAIVELGRWKGPATFFVGIYAFIAVILPLGSIVATSLMVSISKGLKLDNFGFDAWLPVLENSQYLDCIWRSLGYAFIAACIGTLLSLFVAYLSTKTKIRGRSLPDILVMVGGSTPSVVIALALIITFSLTIERHSHHQFLARHTGFQVLLDGFRRSAVARDVGRVEGCVVVAGVSHVVGHHVYEVHILDA